MQFSGISYKDELSDLIIIELKELGVKYKEKKTKPAQNKSNCKRIFRTHLHYLELSDVFLANGNVVQIPAFVANACNRILEQVCLEGIFRKAGSAIRQKEIRTNLEAGLPLIKAYHVVDIANVVKYFFRELPEPLIPTQIHETLIRSLLIGQNHVAAVLLVCLLLPPLTINTLSFFMQFLHTVAVNASTNKMTAENLAIIFTPGLMPPANINSHRFNNHVKLVQLLIENANAIGTIPEKITNKLRINDGLPRLPTNLGNTPSSSFSTIPEPETQKKKKKRRSEMFNGLKKIVGSAIGSSENLENTFECKSTATSMEKQVSQEHHRDQHHQLPQQSTPHISKSSKKRKFADPVCAFSAKKKRDLLALLPSNSGGFLPNTPITKEIKKSRLSLGGNRHLKQTGRSSMERRWSIVGSGWAKNKMIATVNENCQSNDCLFDTKSSISAAPAATSSSSSSSLLTKCSMPKLELPDVEHLSEDAESDCMRISRNEYEAIKERVAAIETRISQEFNSIRKSLSEDILTTTIPSSVDYCDRGLSGPDRVQSKYEEVMVEVEALTSPTTEQLAKRLSRDLKIRRSIDQTVIRSPSARKIGTIRRRSQEKVRLSRTKTWHITSTSTPLVVAPAYTVEPAISSVYAKSKLKRGRPNTLHARLLQQQQNNAPLIDYSSHDIDVSSEQSNASEHWTPAEDFFNDMPPNPVVKCIEMEEKSITQFHTPKILDSSLSTPLKQTAQRPKENSNNPSSIYHTPMLPPKSVPRKISTVRTPNSAVHTSKVSSAVRFLVSPPIEDGEVNGRASIARLRTQNAGMVMAKAKLFDHLGSELNSHDANTNENSNISRRKSIRFISSAIMETDTKSKIQLNEKTSTAAAKQENNSTMDILPTTTSRDKLQSSTTRKLYPRSPPLNIRRQPTAMIVKKPQYNQILKEVIKNEELIQPKNPKEYHSTLKSIRLDSAKISSDSPRTPKIRHHLNTNSPRRVRVLNHASGSNQTQSGKIRNSKSSTFYKNSPRGHKVKNVLKK